MDFGVYQTPILSKTKGEYLNVSKFNQNAIAGNA